MNNISLPKSITKTYFNCMEQQIMTLSQYYHNEVWKLFLNQHLLCVNQRANKLDDVLRYVNPIMENAKEFYGITIKDIDRESKLSFEDNEIYLVNMDLNYYPLTQHLEREGEHGILIYDETEKEYIVNDNFCGVTEYFMEKNLYERGKRRVRLVATTGKIVEGGFENFITTFGISNYETYKNGYNYIMESNIKNFQSADCIKLLSDISCMIKKDSLMAAVWSKADVFLEKCVDILDCLANRVRKNYYVVLKSQLKYENVSALLMYKILEEVLVSLKSEEFVKHEILNVLMRRRCIKEQLHQQILEYLNEEGSAYDIHDEWSIIYLINYFEECNDLKEIEYDDFASCVSYIDFELVVYGKILLKEIVDSV